MTETSMTSDQLITWFWKEFQTFACATAVDAGLCQCESEILIERSQNPIRMRSFLMLGVFLDQITYTHYPQVYEEFRNSFRYPKLYSHGSGGMASPGWLVYSMYGFDEQMDWASAKDIAKPLVHDLLKLIAIETNSRNAIDQFMVLAKREIYWEFEGHTAPKFWALLDPAQLN